MPKKPIELTRQMVFDYLRSKGWIHKYPERENGWLQPGIPYARVWGLALAIQFREDEQVRKVSK